jgi:hypothetical protein
MVMLAMSFLVLDEVPGYDARTEPASSGKGRRSEPEEKVQNANGPHPNPEEPLQA